MKSGCCLSVKHIQSVKQCQFDFAELSTKEIMAIDDGVWEETKKIIKEAGIPVIGFNSFCGGVLPLVGPNVNFEDICQYFDKALSRASDLGCKNIGIGAPAARIIPDTFPYAEATAQMKQFLRYAAERAASQNVNILYEAIQPYKCNFGNHTAEIYETVKELNISNLKMVWDVYHALVAQETFDDAICTFDKIEHVHISSWDEARHRFYLSDKDQELTNQVCKFLKSMNYDKTISVEAPDTDFETIGKLSAEVLTSAIAQA